MTFKEAMEHYRAGTATEEQRQMVEEELEKSKLIAEYMDAQWEEETIIPAAPMEEMKQVRKNLRRRNVLIVLTCLVLVATLLLATVYIGIPAAESHYSFVVIDAVCYHQSLVYVFIFAIIEIIKMDVHPF